MEIINEVIVEINPYAFLYKSMMEKYNEECAAAALAGRNPDRIQMHFLSGVIDAVSMRQLQMRLELFLLVILALLQILQI